MSLHPRYVTVSEHDGFCAGCADVRPLVVQSHGAQGVRAWLAGIGPEDRELSYTCRVCGRVEHVPLTEAEDELYAATLPTWPDWSPVEVPVTVVLPQPVVVVVDPHDVYGLAATQVLTPAAAPVAVAVLRKPQVRILTLPFARVVPTDEHLLALTA